MAIMTNSEAVLYVQQDSCNNTLAHRLGTSLDQASKRNTHKYLCKLFLMYRQTKERLCMNTGRSYNHTKPQFYNAKTF